MKLEMIAIGNLDESEVNIRSGKKPPDVSAILPSVIERGVLLTMLVRDEGKPGRFGVVAGRRRYYAALAAAEAGALTEVPCGILEPGDDAAAIEASMIENFVREDVDEVTLWESFTRLVAQGREVADISATFHKPEQIVRRILALGNLLPRIRELYRKEKIDAATVRHLTLATKKQQTAWLALFNDPNGNCPKGRDLKAWLFGGQEIKTDVALFPLDTYKGHVITDLFGDHAYFDDPDLFWTLQNEAVAAKRDAYIEAGWSAVEIIEPGAHFDRWEHEAVAKAKGGRVIIVVTYSGEVVVHEGYLTKKEARSARKQAEKAANGKAEKPVRSETTSALQRYIDLHRHAAARAVLADHPGIALRLLVAHAITGSPLWSVKVEETYVRDPGTNTSVKTSIGQNRFDEKRRAVMTLLGFPEDRKAVVNRNGDDYRTVELFARLLALDDAQVFAVAAIVMGETIASGSAVVEAVGTYLGIDMAELWTPDDAFFELVGDRETTNAMLRHIGGKKVADGNVTEKVKTQKGIVRDYLTGANQRKKVEGWTPKWLAFPAASYTARPFATLAKWKKVEALVTPLAAPEPAQPGPMLALPAPELEVEEPVAIAAE